MSAIWATDTNVVALGGGATIMPSGTGVGIETSFFSPSGQFELRFQDDGNLVLYQLPATVLFASDTNDMGATLLSMQVDGNLVIYDGDGTPLWESGTNGNPEAYLVLQNDGNLVIYSNEGLQNLGFFSIPPDWSDGSIETLSWLTSVTESPQAVEQRMGLRLSPRQMFEHTYVTFNRRRTHFDMLNMAAAGSPFYLPIWHDKAVLTALAAVGATTLALDTQYTEFQNCTVAALVRNEFDYELVEISGFSDSSIDLAVGVSREWPAGTKIYPCKKVRVESQASGERHADRAFRARMRFQSLEKNDSNAEGLFGEYLGNLVLIEEPNENGGVSYEYNRKEYILDTNVGLQQLSDVAPFIHQNHAWFAKGRERAWRLRGLLYALQGMRRPIWIPSFFADFELAATAAAVDTVLTVLRCGYGDTGGPFLHRDHILIHLRNGTRLYRKIVGSTILNDDTESITLDTAPGVELTPNNVLRISFITFCRLNQDSIELVHHTDSKGLTTASLVWRTDPGIGANYSETTTEIDPAPSIPPPQLVIIDPFKQPAAKAWRYLPSFSTGAENWAQVIWNGLRTEEEIGFPLGDIGVSDSRIIDIPPTGSFLVRARMFWINQFGAPPIVKMRIFFLNSHLEPLEVQGLGALTDPPRVPLIAQTKRESVYYATVDHEQPLQVRIEEFCTAGGGFISPAADENDGDGEPFVTGNSFFIVEWWP